MTDSTLGPRQAVMGDNNPPDIIAELRALLAVANASLIARRDQLLGACDRAPPEIEDETMAGKVADLIKLVMACHKTSEAARVSAKEPFLEQGRAVDGFFKAITDPLEKAKRGIEARLTAWQRKVAEIERQRRLDEQQAAQVEADRKAEEARAAEAAIQTEADLPEAIAKAEGADQARADATLAAKDAAAKPAELSRSRGDLGSVASLRTEWVGELVDRRALDLEALRQHIPADGLEKAIRAFVRAGGRELRGAKIYESSRSVVR